MANRYQVYLSKTPLNPDRVARFSVNDGKTIADANERPDAAIFTVSILHDEDTQRNRAHKLCDYLNSLVDVVNDLEKEQTL